MSSLHIAESRCSIKTLYFDFPVDDTEEEGLRLNTKK